jgi:hypothetical protein
MKKKLITKKKVSTKPESKVLKQGTVSGSLHEMRAINTYKEMKEQLTKLKQDVSFREYIGCEIAMKIFYKRYEKWLSNDR